MESKLRLKGRGPRPALAKGSKLFHMAVRIPWPIIVAILVAVPSIVRAADAPVPTGTGPECAKYLQIPDHGDPRRTLDPNSRSVDKPIGEYADLAHNCIFELKTKPVAWRVLTSMGGGFQALHYPSVELGNLRNTLPHPAFVTIALLAENGHGCDRYRGSSYNPLTMGLDAWHETDQVFVEHRGCWAEIVIRRNDPSSKFNSFTLATGEELYAALKADPSLSQPSRLSVFQSSDGSARVVASLVNAPGSWAISHIWMDPDQDYGFIAALLISWLTWVTALRLSWCILARRFGLYNPDHFWLWTWLWPWRPLYMFARKGLPFIREGKQGTGATGRWAPFLETMSLVFKPGYIFLGRLRWRGIPFFQPIGIDGSAGGGHLAMISSSGTGKTTLLMTMLGLHRGNAFVVDCDAQMVNAVGKRLGQGGIGIFGRGNQVCVLDPHSLARDMPSSSWNAIEEMDRYIKEHGMDRAIEFAQTVAEALIREEEEGKNNVWVARDARILIRGLVLYVFLQKTNRNLPEVRRLLMLGLDREVDGKRGINALILDMQRYREFGGAIAAAAAELDKGDGKNYALSSAKGQTLWLDLPLMQKICSHSDFDLHDLVGGRLCVFVCAPVTDVQKKLSGYFRLLTMLSMEAFQQWKGPPPKRRCLFAIDEMPALGHIDVIQTSASTFRKYNVRLLCIAQDIPRLKKVYPEGWSGFLSDAAASIWMGVSPEDKETMETLQLGLTQSTRQEAMESGLFSDVSGRMQKVERPIIYPNQLKEFFTAGGVVVIRNGRNPLRLQNSPYYKELPVYFYDRDEKKFRERIGRRIGRQICRRVIIFKNGTPPDSKALTKAQTRPPKREPMQETQSTSDRAYAAEPPSNDSFADNSNVGRFFREEPPNQGRTKNSPRLKPADINFLRVFTECFDEKEGAYPHPRIRRQVWEGFAPYIMQGGDFLALKLQLEDWLASEIPERTRAEHVMIFFEDWIDHSRRREQDGDAAAEA